MGHRMLWVGSASWGQVQALGAGCQGWRRGPLFHGPHFCPVPWCGLDMKPVGDGPDFLGGRAAGLSSGEGPRGCRS